MNDPAKALQAMLQTGGSTGSSFAPNSRYFDTATANLTTAEGRTIVLSSHILEEVEQVADTVLLIVNGKLAASGGFRAIRAALNQRPYHVRIICDSPRHLAAAVVKLNSVDAVHLDPDGAIVVLSRNVQDLQIELPRLAKSESISLRRVEPLDDSLESVFGYLVEA